MINDCFELSKWVHGSLTPHTILHSSQNSYLTNYMYMLSWPPSYSIQICLKVTGDFLYEVGILFTRLTFSHQAYCLLLIWPFWCYIFDLMSRLFLFLCVYLTFSVVFQFLWLLLMLLIWTMSFWSGCKKLWLLSGRRLWVLITSSVNVHFILDAPDWQRLKTASGQSR